jgi:uncharacterized membrane protein
MDLISLIGRFHPVVLHLPIGALFTIAVAEVWLRRATGPKEQVQLFVLYLFALVTSLMAVVTGLILSEEDVYGGSTLELHEKLGIATGVATLLVAGIAWMVVRTGSKGSPLQTWIRARWAGLGVTLFLITLTGHFGGELTHGKDFLTEFGPAFLRQDAETTANEVDVETTAFDAAIYPILESYCIYCHDAETTKGRLRMDSPEAMLAGGSSGALFIAGDSENSLMLQRIHLPLEHDDHMPPATKRQPTEEEVAALVWWIQSGASFEMKLADAQVPDSVRSLVPEPEATDTPGVPKGELDLDAVQNLRDQLLTVQRIQQGDDRLWINFSAIATTADDDFIEQLRPLAPYIAWLDLSRTQITDASMPVIAAMQPLEELNLHACQITDQGLAALSGLGQLKKLNLTHTPVSDASLPVLRDLKSLEIVYLFQSQWSPEGIEQLRAARPDLTVQAGE